jgi:hypothetical protein
MSYSHVHITYIALKKITPNPHSIFTVALAAAVATAGIAVVTAAVN